jgi:hypothetical protein
MIPILGLSFVIHNQLNKYTPPVVDNLPALLVDDTLTADVFPTIMVKNEEGKSLPIQLSDLKIDVKVIGNIATTTMEMTFYNDSNTVLEGQLYFPLGEGQSVSRFAMDVDGKLREGVIVEKEKGQEVFESIVRQNVDPGLLEWTKGNNFKARVYPIPSKGHKRIVVAYEQELDRLAQGYLYLLPLNFKEKVDQFDLRVEVFNQEIKPTLEQNSLVNLKFEKWEENYVAEFSKKNFLPGSQLGLTLPTPKNAQQIYTEKVPGTENQYYFYTTLTPRKGKVEIKAPNTIGLIWDASTSGQNRDIERELSLLDSFFAQNKNVTVKFISLRNTAKMVKTYSVKNGDWSTLRTRIKEIPFDGASAYESIDYSKYPCDVFLLFGDGLSNFGLKDGKLPKVAVNTINSSTSANHSYLKYLSSATGGEYVNLLKTENTVAVELLRGGNFQYYGNGQANTYPSMPTTVQSEVHVAGIITGKAELDFAFGYGEASSQIHMTIDPEEHLTNTGLLRRIWAQKKLAELDINPDKNDEAITALGMEFGIVTCNTSLIVLDRVEDYVEHEIVPPTELQKEYFAQLKEIKKNTDAEQAAHMKQVKEEFKAYVDWWNTDYDIAKILAEDKKVAAISDENRDFRGDSVVVNYDMAEPVMNMSEISVQEDASYAFSTDAVSNGTVNTLADAAGAKEKKTKGKKNAEIQLEKWEPDAPYMKTLKKASDETLYTTYLGLKKENSSTPSFFLDVSDLFIEKGEKELALRILSNIAEMELESHELLRVLAHRLEQLEYYKLAIMIYEDVAKIRQEEPQSFRDLGLCLAKEGSYQEAVDMLYKVVETTWDGRFPGIESIALAEINQIVALHKNKVDTKKIDPEFLNDLPVDVRVILNWDADNCDMDLWVTDPRMEKCFYSNKNTKIGGRMSNDFTRGYGPEMFTIKNAMKGKYVVQVDYYGTTSQRISGPTTIQIQLVTNYGRPNEKVQEITRRLSTQKEILDIGSLIFE